MVTWADTDTAIEAERSRRQRLVENLTLIVAMFMLASALWLAWPSINAIIGAESVNLTTFGPPVVLLLWGIFLQDLALDEAAARSRLGASSSVAWPVLAVLGTLGLTESSLLVGVGSALVLLAALVCRTLSIHVLRGSFGVLRFRSLMTGVGCLTATVLVLSGGGLSSFAGQLSSVVLFAAVVDTGYHWYTGDVQRDLRKVFRLRLNALEGRLLEMKAAGAAVDQASSLLTTAKEEGHLDLEYGMGLLDDCEEDMDRAVSLAGDVDAVRVESLKTVDEAEELAPVVKRPRKAYNMGVREVDLGSLREGELLFRQAKKRALEIIEWWGKAERSIAEAARALDGNNNDDTVHLRELLADAKSRLAAEAPKEAYEFAVVIPAQLAAGDEALGRAAESVKQAQRTLNSTDGLDLSDLKQRLEKANIALEAGQASQAIGLADGVVRTIERERVAMDDVRRALKQKKQLVKRFEGRADEPTWRTGLKEIEQAAQDQQWSHAGMLLDRLTSRLDQAGQEADEALELYDFVLDEWRVLRNQCDASRILVEDEDRRACEHAVALAGERLGESDIAACLIHLSEADAAMERLRRRV